MKYLKTDIHLDDPSGCSGYKVHAYIEGNIYKSLTVFEDDVMYLLTGDGDSYPSDYSMFESGKTSFDVKKSRFDAMAKRIQKRYSLSQC